MAQLIVSGALLVSGASHALADEGGISVYVPGFYGSFAAVPSEPGWSLGTVYYHANVDAGAGASFPRGGNGQIDVGIQGRGDAVFVIPTYTFAEPVIGGAQASIGLLTAAAPQSGRGIDCIGGIRMSFHIAPEDLYLDWLDRRHRNLALKNTPCEVIAAMIDLDHGVELL